MHKRWYPAAVTAFAIGCGGVTDNSITTSGGSSGENGGATTTTDRAGSGTSGDGGINTGAPTGGRSILLTGSGGIPSYGMLGGGINTSLPTGGTSSTVGWTGGAYGVSITGGRTGVSGSNAAGGSQSTGGSNASTGGIDAGFPTGGADALGGQWTCDYGCQRVGGGSSIDILTGGTSGVDGGNGGS